MISTIFAIVSFVKLLPMWSYRSTDFEVHRNWLAITHSLPISQWYFDSTSEWTLDYPPFFAYFEFILSHIAKYFDAEMLKVENLNYASDQTIFFQRISVIFSDITLLLGLKLCIKTFEIRDRLKMLVVSWLIIFNVGLFFVDHIHFQYNGFLLGILLLSIGYIAQRNYLLSALMFSILLNLKHIFLYIAPIYVVYLFKHYCLKNKNSLINFGKLVIIPSACLIASFGPFITHLPQVFSRLFPFKRGLTHAYWAPNFWALYNFGDKVGSILLKVPTRAANTGGLVQEYEHSLFPSITPLMTFALTAIFMIPCLIKLFLIKSKKEYVDFVRGIIICTCTSYMFGWHVHEKAVLMFIIPLGLLAPLNYFDAEAMLFLSTVGHFSLFPLLFKPKLLILLRYCMHFTYTMGAYLGFKQIYPTFRVKFHEKLFFLGLVCICIYEDVIQYLLNFNEKLPFLPLMLTSVYCSIGMIYFYCKYYYKFLSTKEHNSTTKKRKAK